MVEHWEIHQIIGLMCSDKSNDWSEEVEVLERLLSEGLSQ